MNVEQRLMGPPSLNLGRDYRVACAAAHGTILAGLSKVLLSFNQADEVEVQISSKVTLTILIYVDMMS